MKYLHIIKPSIRMMKGYMMMYRNHFDSSEHVFLTCQATLPNDYALLFFDNVIDYPSLGKGKLRKYKAIKKLMDDADYIIFHGLNFSQKWILMMWMNQYLLNKCIWYMWGIDLYNYLLPKTSLKNRFLNKINTTVRKKIKYPCAALSSDIDVYHKLICEDRKVYCAANPNSDQSFKELDSLSEKQMELHMTNAMELALAEFENENIEEDVETKSFVYDHKSGKVNSDEKNPGDDNESNKKKINIDDLDLDTDEILSLYNKQRLYRIMVGNNAHSFNRHKEILDLLDKFNDENIRIVIPVNYGEDTLAGPDYVKKLDKYANMLFDKKVGLMTKFLQLNEYHAFLASVDVGIFNANRQNALGNIIKLLYMGKKVYLNKKDNPIFDVLASHGLPIHDVSELKTASFEEFIEKDDAPVPNPWIYDFFSEEGASNYWKKIFAEIAEIDGKA